jgi:hypothetical protein
MNRAFASLPGLALFALAFAPLAPEQPSRRCVSDDRGAAVVLWVQQLLADGSATATALRTDLGLTGPQVPIAVVQDSVICRRLSLAVDTASGVLSPLASASAAPVGVVVVRTASAYVVLDHRDRVRFNEGATYVFDTLFAHRGTVR